MYLTFFSEKDLVTNNFQKETGTSGFGATLYRSTKPRQKPTFLLYAVKSTPKTCLYDLAGLFFAREGSWKNGRRNRIFRYSSISILFHRNLSIYKIWSGWILPAGSSFFNPLHVISQQFFKSNFLIEDSLRLRKQLLLYHSLQILFSPIRSQLAQAPTFWPKRSGRVLCSNLGPLALHSHALLTTIAAWESAFLFEISSEWNFIAFLTCI